MTARARSGCQPCRIRHLKCDQATPKCGRCKAADRECSKGYPYRVYKSKFKDNQKWMKTPLDLTFVDETQCIFDNDDPDSDSENELPRSENKANETASSKLRGTFPRTENSSAVSHYNKITRSDPASTPRTLVPLENISESPLQGLLEEHGTASEVPRLSQVEYTHLPSPNPSTTKGILNSEAVIESPHTNDQPKFQVDPNLLPSIYLDTPVWPLTDPAEALLLRHFVQNLAIWLDLCDPMQHFQVEVPRRAGTCPILLNAIFALSARHLSHIGNFDSFASNRYHQECLKYLIPMLNNTATVSDETLFAATIILRVLEEIELPDTEDLQGHMLGIQVFVGARSPYSMRGGLSEAAFWVGLRQEIYVATIKHKSVLINLDHSLVDRSLESTSDFGWANRAVVFYADVLNCCFGTEGIGRTRWEELKVYSEGWDELKPSSFRPIYRREADTKKGERFPEIWYSHACHIIGIQHFKLAQMLLAIFDPTIPRLGGNRRVAVHSMEEQIKPKLRELSGIGLHNQWTPPGIFTASMGIAICGDRFEDKADQEALLDVLVKTESDHARRTGAVQKQMKEAWGWICED